MKIIGLTRVRNEEEIIRETLDHMATFCDMIFVYDDCSTDKTSSICLSHPKVSKVISGLHWDKNRKRAEWQNRSVLLDEAKRWSISKDWFVYLDADERIDYDFSKLKDLPTEVIGIRMKLFDFYITPEDVNKHYSKRRFCGPEYRNILMAYRNLATLDFSSPDQREVHLRHKGTVLNEGFVKHYGKAVSVKQWEETCNYYSKYFPKYSAKWERRKGKAIHTCSSFGLPLITWNEKETKGVPLTQNIEKHSIY